MKQISLLMLSRIAFSLGLPVYDAQFEDSGISGAIQKSSHGGKIWVNQFDSMVRQRFTMAHEIGHWTLHMIPGNAWSAPQNLVDVELVEWRNGTAWSESDQQRKANQFAAALLMPLPLLDTLQLAHPEWPTHRLTNYCRRVSLSAMSIRLERMRRLSWASCR